MLKALMQFRNPKPRSLVGSLALLTALSVALVTSVYGVFSYQSQKHRIVSDMHTDAQASLKSLSENSLPFIEAYAPREYEKLVQTEARINHYAAIILEDFKMGEILGRERFVTGQVRRADGDYAAYSEADVAHRESLEDSYLKEQVDLVQSDGEIVGTLTIYMDDAQIRQKLDEVLYNTLQSSLFLAAILMALLTVFSRRAVIRPLQQVAEILKERDEDGIPTGKLPRVEYREIAALTKIMNAMLEVIRHARKVTEEERIRLRAVLEGTHVGTWEWNVQTGAVVFNARWAEIIGYTLEELEPVSIETWTRFCHPDDLKESERLLKAHFAGEADYYRCEARMRHKNGQWVWVLDRGRVSQRTADGEPLMMYGTHQDITAQKETESTLRQAASVFEHVREGIMITDGNGLIQDVNAAFSRITGYSIDEVRGCNPRLLKSGRQSDRFYASMWQALQSEGYWSGEIWNRRKGGEVYPELLTISAVHDADGNLQSYVALLADISRLKEHERQLEQLAHYDSLTGLPNRLILSDRMRKAMSQAQRRKEILGVAFLDLDGFKSVNDQYGHDVGDQLLIVMAERVSHTLRESDTLVRLGGDEFVALLPDLADTDHCLAILRRMLSAVSHPIHVSGYQVHVSASIGVTFYPQSSEVDGDQLLRQADQAMYEAKLAGKNRYHLFDTARDRTLRDQHQRVERIRQALNDGEFRLYYQPKVNLRTGRVVGAEALIRWQHPEDGLLLPGQFLPVVENDPLMFDIGEWVLCSALQRMDLWHQQGIDLVVSINVSAIELQMPGFVEQLRAALNRFPDLDPSLLQLEVVETSALENLRQVSQVMHDCLEIGVSFAIDDFGTGYSSLAYLKGLPAQELKIDQSFVREMLHDPEDLAILRGIVGLAGAFGKRVIAEGMESQEHGSALLALGCELAQGFGIAHPMPEDQLPDWINQYHQRH